MDKSRRNSRSFWAVGLGAVALAGYFKGFRPFLLNWGATPDEINRSLPGDALFADPLLRTTHSITINATPGEIWPWLVQMGQGRGGFYSYDWLENLFGLDIHNADCILPEHQNLCVGDVMPFREGVGVRVMDMENERFLVLGGTLYGEGRQTREAPVGGSWIFFLQPLEAESTRLIVRSYVARFPPLWLSILFSRLVLEPGHFIMERAMLKGIKRRVEAARGVAS